MRLMLLAALGAAGMMLTGCASVARGTSESVVFDSDPPGAEMRSVVDYPCGGPCPVRDDKVGSAAAYMGDVRTPEVPGPACVTPCTLQVPRNQPLVVTMAKAGYEPRTVKLATTVRAGGAVGVAGNIVAGGLVGMAVDAGTGAALDHCPNPLKVVLRRVGSREPLVPFNHNCPMTAEARAQPIDAAATE